LYNGHSLETKIRDWRSQIAYLPQNVFLIDNTLRRNVALGVQDEFISDDEVLAALQKAQLENLVRQLPNGIDTVLGERGVRISGGQRQRIALARAFYHGRSVLVMDESTSALDNDTEKLIVEEIKRLKGEKTMIVIAHRLTTLQHCDRIYMLTGGGILKETVVKC
jgi:ABC-type multidrug transport system fused ATPase/permease subunit